MYELVQIVLIFVILSQRFVLILFQEQEVPDCQNIQFGAHEALECVGRRTDYWFSSNIERRVDDYGAACELLKATYQRVIPRVGVGMNRLNSCRVVYVRYRRNL